MSWKQLTAVTQPNYTELVSELFSSLGAASVTFQDAADQPLYEPNPGEIKVWKWTQIIGLFENTIDTEAIQTFISNQLPANTISKWNLESFQDQAWERVWLKHFKPMRFGKRLWVCPSGTETPDAQGVRLTLDPGLAFGTGTHPTTALCLKWLDSQELKNKTVIDYGCGSGILGIAALLLGAREVFAIDIDSQALTATRDNAKNNNVFDQIHCYSPDNLPAVQANFLLANILANPLIQLSKEIADLVHKDGELVLSGILPDQAESVAAAFQPYFDLEPFIVQDDWIRISGKKNTS
ncbi:MAG: 50S ribosomal protein L11 methyltransferase [Methylococcales bacterium]